MMTHLRQRRQNSSCAWRRRVSHLNSVGDNFKPHLRVGVTVKGTKTLRICPKRRLTKESFKHHQQKLQYQVYDLTNPKFEFLHLSKLSRQNHRESIRHIYRCQFSQKIMQTSYRDRFQR